MSLTSEERSRIVALARQAVEAELSGRPLPVPPPPYQGALGQRLGCFVTLTRDGRLRGCIGTFHPEGPLAQTLPRIAAESCRDSRFVHDPVTLAEVPRLTIEVSILSPLTPMKSIDEFRLGTHGIFIVQGRRAGCFLPEVATDMGWEAEQFFDECCVGKAGLPRGAWKQPGTKVYLFTSEKFDH